MYKNPSDALLGLQEYCKAHDLSYSIQGGKVTVGLPEEKKAVKADTNKPDMYISYTFNTDTAYGVPIHDLIIQGSTFDAQGWPTSPVDESGHDPDTPLKEGETPDAL